MKNVLGTTTPLDVPFLDGLRQEVDPTADRVAKLNDAVIRILQRKDVVEQFAVQGGIVPPPMTPAEVAEFVRNDVALWRKLVSEAKIQAD